MRLDSCGRGNNWAHGYTETKGLDAISNALRRLVEQESRFNGTMILSSVAGGTGSGLGSRMLEDISQDYPKKHIINCP